MAGYSDFFFLLIVTICLGVLLGGLDPGRGGLLLCSMSPSTGEIPLSSQRH